MLLRVWQAKVRRESWEEFRKFNETVNASIFRDLKGMGLKEAWIGYDEKASEAISVVLWESTLAFEAASSTKRWSEAEEKGKLFLESHEARNFDLSKRV